MKNQFNYVQRNVCEIVTECERVVSGEREQQQTETETVSKRFKTIQNDSNDWVNLYRGNINNENLYINADK